MRHWMGVGQATRRRDRDRRHDRRTIGRGAPVRIGHIREDKRTGRWMAGTPSRPSLVRAHRRGNGGPQGARRTGCGRSPFPGGSTGGGDNHRRGCGGEDDRWMRYDARVLLPQSGRPDPPICRLRSSPGDPVSPDRFDLCRKPGLAYEHGGAWTGLAPPTDDGFGGHLRVAVTPRTGGSNRTHGRRERSPVTDFEPDPAGHAQAAGSAGEPG